MISPIIRYVGAKSAAMSQILNRFPMNIQEYREPFIGGGSVLLGMLQHRSKPSIVQIGDKDYDIANMWESIINYPNALVETLRRQPKELRSILGLAGVPAASTYIINNIFRQFGNWGTLISEEDSNKKVERFTREFEVKVYGISNLLQGTTVVYKSYEWAFAECDNTEETLIFLDPPYTEVSKNNEYYSCNQNTFDYEHLRELLINTKIPFIMTLDANSFGYSLSKNLIVHEYEMYYRMSRKIHKELIITNIREE